MIRTRVAAAGAYASLAALTGISAWHTATTVCSIEGAPVTAGGWPCVAGIVAAVALEVGALSLAYAAAHAYAVTGRHSRLQWAGVLALSATAVFTNADAVGGAIVGGVFSVDAFHALDAWQRAKVIVLSGAWPLLATFLAATVETLAAAPAPRVDAVAPARTREAAARVSTPRAASKRARTRRTGRHGRAADDALAAIVDAVARSEFGAPNAAIGRAAGMTRQTATNWLRRAADAGMIAGDTGAWRLTDAGRMLPTGD